jgi:hypothetical protein
VTAASADALPWVDVVVNGKPMRRCQHGDFARTDVCKKCTKTRRAMPKAEKVDLPEPPKGCMSSVQIERWFVEMAESSRASAERIEAAYKQPKPPPPPTPPTKPTKKGAAAKPAEPEVAAVFRDFHDEAAIANHRDRAIKAMRAATELATRREDDWIVDRRDEVLAGRERGASH